MGKKTLVAGSVGDGVWSGARQAEQNRVIVQLDISQAKSDPLPVQVPGPGLLTVTCQAGERPGTQYKDQES